MKFYTVAKACGDRIHCFDTIEDAMDAVKAYEKEDKKYGDYSPDMYDIQNEDYCSIELTTEPIIVNNLESLDDFETYLCSTLMLLFALNDSTYPNKDSSETPQDLIINRECYEELSKRMKKLSEITYKRIKKWKRICTSDELERIQRYSNRLTALNADIKYFDKLYNEQIAPIKPIDSNHLKTLQNQVQNATKKFGIEIWFRKKLKSCKVL